MNCDPPEVPYCEDGQTVVLKNPGDCQPIHECGMTSNWLSLLYLSCLHAEKQREYTDVVSFTFFFPTTVCKKEECSRQALPDCPAHRRLSIKMTKCCDVLECVCNCQNFTQSCAPGFITTSSTNDCGCTETSCLPDKVSLHLWIYNLSTFLIA